MQRERPRRKPNLGIQLAAKALGVHRTSLYRAVTGQVIPKDPTVLPRFYEYMRKQAVGGNPCFGIYPPEHIRLADDAMMRQIAASYPAAFAYDSSGLRVLQPVSFFVTCQMPIPEPGAAYSGPSPPKISA